MGSNSLYYWSKPKHAGQKQEVRIMTVSNIGKRFKYFGVKKCMTSVMNVATRPLNHCHLTQSAVQHNANCCSGRKLHISSVQKPAGCHVEMMVASEKSFMRCPKPDDVPRPALLEDSCSDWVMCFTPRCPDRQHHEAHDNPQCP